jgi:hypothetical protein
MLSESSAHTGDLLVRRGFFRFRTLSQKVFCWLSIIHLQLQRIWPMGELHRVFRLVCSLTDKIHQNQTVLTGPSNNSRDNQEDLTCIIDLATGQYRDTALDKSVARKRPNELNQPIVNCALMAAIGKI